MDEILYYDELVFDYEGGWLDISYTLTKERKNSTSAYEITAFDLAWVSYKGEENPVNLVLSMDDIEYAWLAEAVEKHLKEKNVEKLALVIAPQYNKTLEC
jgi:hypothetical protein